MKARQYDYIIVGAGSAGCVLASRLTADPAVSVLLLEAGGDDKSIFLRMPAAFAEAMKIERFNWGYATQPEPGLDGRTLACPRGKVLGGSSSINGMVYVRGHPSDFDEWESLGAAGWNYRNCLPYFRRAERWRGGADRYRGDDGPIGVALGSHYSRNPLNRAFIEAGVQAGYPRTEDYNGASQEGFGPLQMSVHRGVRASTARAYLAAALRRPNLTVVKGALVDTVLLDGKTAVGVQYNQLRYPNRVPGGATPEPAFRSTRSALAMQRLFSGASRLTPATDSFVGAYAVGAKGASPGKVPRPPTIDLAWPVNEYVHGLKAYAQREVILAAGAIGSPCLLQRSGIGPRDVVGRAGVHLRHELPGVGQNLQDHLEVYCQYRCHQPITLNGRLNPLRKALIGLRWLLLKDGLGGTNHFEAGAFFRSTPSRPWPDVQLHFLPAAMRYDGTEALEGHGFQVHVGPNKPNSRGRVWIESKRADAEPGIRFNYLSDKTDVLTWRRCIRLVREVMRQPALDSYRGEEVQPGAGVASDAEIDDWVRRNAESAYHPSCTCKMGDVEDDSAVVDPACRVRGLNGLRVVDASIFPSITNGNLNAPTIMVAERAADLILGRVPA